MAKKSSSRPARWQTAVAKAEVAVSDLRAALEELEELRTFNVNHHVQVKLTDEGRRIHRDTLTPPIGSRYGYSPPIETSDCWSRWQLHQLMNLFGQHLYPGCELPFETTIRLETEEAGE
jgi:hypothetical protein